jgi:hypothetical protein
MLHLIGRHDRGAHSHHQKSSYRIELGVAQGFPEMGLVKRARVLAPLPDVPAGAVFRVPVGGKSAMCLLQTAAHPV